MKRHQPKSPSRFIRQLAVCTLLLLSAAEGSADEAEEKNNTPAVVMACPGAPVSVYSCNELDRRLLCAAADEAFGFFGQYGISRQQPLDINLCDKRVPFGSGSAIGRYDSRSGDVRLLSYEAYRQLVVEDPPFGMPSSEALYRSFGVHEIAHAIADENFRISSVPWLSQEYIAAVAQLATMEPRLRASILARYHLEAFHTTASMSTLYYQLDPSAFAIKAYLHFIALDDQGAFLRKLLSGAIRLGDDEDWLARGG